MEQQNLPEILTKKMIEEDLKLSIYGSGASLILLAFLIIFFGILGFFINGIWLVSIAFLFFFLVCLYRIAGVKKKNNYYIVVDTCVKKRKTTSSEGSVYHTLYFQSHGSLPLERPYTYRTNLIPYFDDIQPNDKFYLLFINWKIEPALIYYTKHWHLNSQEFSLQDDQYVPLPEQQNL